MLKPIFLHTALSASALLFSATGFAQPMSEDGVPPLPANGIYPVLPVFSWPDGELSWITSVATGKNPAQAVSSFWNPSTGKTRQELLSIDGSVHSRAKTSHGIMLLVGTANAAQRLVLLAAKTSILSAPLLVARSNPQMVVLSDQSVVILGGRANDQRTAAAELVRHAAGRLVVEQLPDLPGELRTGYSAVALADGRLMVLGGNSGRYIGCWPCTEETYFLDPLSKTWKGGPKLPEPGADATATLLPDGQVLLAGGWTPEFGWSEGPTRGTALFNPLKNMFVPAQPLPTAVAMHQALWAPQGDGKNDHGQLLVTGGNSASVQSFDVASGQWRLVGESCDGDEKGGSLVLPFVFKNQSYLWRRANESGFCATKVQGWSLSALRLPSSNREPGRMIHWKTGIALYRSQLAFAPSNGAGIALAVGGAIHAGMNAYLPTAAVDAIWPDGRIVALPSLLHARQGAQVVALPDGGFFVAGGTGDKKNPPLESLPVEWLAGAAVASGAPWVTLDAQFSKDAVFGHLADGRVLALTAGTNLQSLVFADTGKGRPTVGFNALPGLPHERRNAEDSRVLIKGLSDGRIIAAGGDVQDGRSKADGEPGSHRASRYHDIYDPSRGAWKRSAPSRGSGVRWLF